MINELKRIDKLLTRFAIFFILFTSGTCSICETPDEWLSGNVEVQDLTRAQEQTENYTIQNGSNRWITWPNGIVKYKLHSSLTLKDTSEVLKAFDEYHSKTCIRFKPWKKGDLDFVSIEMDENICGLANVCKIGGPQVVKFGKNCRNMKTMVHQLGHALCLGHEHQRLDRDQFLNFSSCSSSPQKVESLRRPTNLYDYNSQMHSKCGTCDRGMPNDEMMVPDWAKHVRCGPDASPGLSILDVDNINYLYNCQGCQRHRWVPAASLSHDDFSKLLTFGYETENGMPIFACRARKQAEIVSGMFDYAHNTCKISWDNNPFEIEGPVEVLTIPGGAVGDDCSVYKLVDWRNVIQQQNSLISVGNIFYEPFWNWTSHIAYAKVPASRVGKIWLESGVKFHPDAEINMGDSSSRTGVYQVLTCEFDSTCMLKQIFGSHRAYQHQGHVSN